MDFLSIWVHRVVFAEPMMLVFLGLGLGLSVWLGFPQVRLLRVVLLETLGAIRERHFRFGGQISPFQAAMVALSGSLGTGQLVGVVGAILAGGPGAIFWMWVFYLLATVLKFAEAILAVHFRQEFTDGSMLGGVMVYIRRGLGPKWAWLAGISAALIALASFGIGNFAQAGAVGAAFLQEYRISPAFVGLLMAAVVGMVLVGGVRRIAQLAQILVPIKLGLLLLGLLPLLFLHFSHIPQALTQIFTGAFSFHAAAGGAAGAAIILAFGEIFRSGVAQGIFSSEAGLGSSSVAYAQAQVDHPVRQGFWGITEMLISLLTSSIVALTFLASGLWTRFMGQDKTEAARFLFAEHPLGVPMLILLLTFLALGTMISWSFYGEEGAAYLLGEGIRWPYRLTFVTVVFMGSLVGSSQTLNLWVDNLNGFLAIPNLIALVLLVGLVKTLVSGFFSGSSWKPPKDQG